jgi:hypothetical protein
MAQFDTASVIAPSVGLNTAAITSNTTTNGVIIDTQGYNSLTYLLNVGARTDGTFTPSIQHGDAANLSDAATVTADDLVGTYAGAAISAAQTVKKIGYVGNKRYVRLQVVSTSVSSGATVGATALLGEPEVGAIAQ